MSKTQTSVSMKGSLLIPVLGSPGMTGSKQQRSRMSFHLPYLTLFFFFFHGLVFFPRQTFSLGMPTLHWGEDSSYIIIQSLAASYVKLGVRTFILTRLDHILSLSWWGVPPKEGEITRKRKGVGTVEERWFLRIQKKQTDVHCTFIGIWVAGGYWFEIT